MRLRPKLPFFLVMLLLGGCRAAYVPPEQPMPPQTILLSQVMRELSVRPGFTEALLKELEGAKQGDTRRGPALLTPALIDELRKRILGRDWEGLDRFPGWTMREINPTVRVAGHVLAKDEKLQALSAVHPGAAPALDDRQARTFIDLGPYPLDREQTISLDQPSTLPPFTTEGLVSDLGGGVTRGDGPNEFAAEHAESQRLADVLNRLAANRLEGAKAASVSLTASPASESDPRHAKPRGAVTVHTPEELLSALAATHTVTVNDARYFANFGHLHYRQAATDAAADVMMPFWVDTQIAVPDRRGWLHRIFFRPRALLVPVSHAEYEWHIRGPRINADVSYYFGIDGKSEWRTMDTLDQPWVLKRNAHTYTGEQAVEVTRLAGLLTAAMLRQHARRPELPFGGYYALGVCQDGVSAIEKKMTGRVTLFPNTADTSLFDDPRDAEINALLQAIPKDRAGAMPEPERVFGSLPAEPGQDARFSSIVIPGLANDLELTYAAWQRGSLQRTHGRLFWFLVGVGSFAVFAAAAANTARQLRKAKRRTFADTRR